MGYGLWTAGIGFQAGAENGGHEHSDGTGQYPETITDDGRFKSPGAGINLLLRPAAGRKVANQQLGDQIHLKRGIIGSERWGDKMRSRIAEELGIERCLIFTASPKSMVPAFPSTAANMRAPLLVRPYLYFEILDQETLKPVPEGEYGELVITAASGRKGHRCCVTGPTTSPALFIPGPCACGSVHPAMTGSSAAPTAWSARSRVSIFIPARSMSC